MARKKIEEDSKEALQKHNFGMRILQIRRTFFDDNNRKFAERIGENEKTLSQICSGDRNGGWAIIQKILDNMPEINANWLLRGDEEMTRSNHLRVGNIHHNAVVGGDGTATVNHTNGTSDLLALVQQQQDTIAKQAEQIVKLTDRLLER